MKKYHSILAVLLLCGLTACFDERDEEYDLIGALGTVVILDVSEDGPAPDDEISVDYRYYSEHVEVRELRLQASIDGGEPELIQRREVSDHNLADSYEGAFTYTVPEVDPCTTITLTIEIETVNDLVNTDSADIRAEYGGVDCDEEE